ncbi:MAG: isochorismatase family protein [Actinomycetaceae bacterium]|nr:isochorismatase family protein [Actinomycetaceae bacterium]
MKNAVIIIDVQESFRKDESWATISPPDIAERCNTLVDAAGSRGDLIVWVLHTAPGSKGPFDMDSGHVVLLPELHNQATDLSVIKTSHNAFTTTNLDQQLRRAGVTHLTIAGIRTEQCVETTARIASDMGYSVEVVIDACATHPLPTADGLATLSPKDITERTAAALSGRFARITTVAEFCS